MSELEKAAYQYSAPTGLDGSQLAMTMEWFESKAFKAGARWLAEHLINSVEWDCTNWVEIPKEELRKLVE